MAQDNEQLHGGGSPTSTTEPSHPDILDAEEIEARKRWVLDRRQEVALLGEVAHGKDGGVYIDGMGEKDFGHLFAAVFRLGIAAAAPLFSSEDETKLLARGGRTLRPLRYLVDSTPEIPADIQDPYVTADTGETLINTVFRESGLDTTGRYHDEPPQHLPQMPVLPRTLDQIMKLGRAGTLKDRPMESGE